jgi:beta-glucosidase
LGAHACSAVAIAVAQGEPPQQLRDFAKVQLKAGTSAKVQLKLSERDRSVWGGGGWAAVSGTFGVVIGESSRDPNAVKVSFTV